MKPDQPSTTAILIAKSVVFVAGDRRYKPLMPRSMVDLSSAFLSAATTPTTVKMFAALGRLPPARWLVQLLQRASVPGMIGHYIVRKLRLYDLVAETATRFGGLDQLVIFGAGLDTLGTRIALERPGLRVFEIDHPATSAAKTRAFAQGSVSIPPNLSLHAIDLGAVDSRAVLQTTKGFVFTARTLFVAEGVFMYLPMEAFGRTLDLIADFPPGRAAFAFTYMLPSVTDGRPAFQGQNHLVDRWLGRKREPFVWGATPDALNTFIHARGLKVLGHCDAAALRKTYLGNPGQASISTAVGENIAWVER